MCFGLDQFVNGNGLIEFTVFRSVKAQSLNNTLVFYVIIIIQCLVQTHKAHIQAPYTHIKIKKHYTARAVLVLN